MRERERERAHLGAHTRERESIWAHIRERERALGRAYWWWLRRGPPHMIVKRFGCTTIHNKALYKCIIHSYERERERPCDMMSPLQLFITWHTGQTEMFWSVLAFLGSHGFPENADRMTESIHKNRIYSIAQNTMKFVNLWMNKKKSVTKFESRYELMYVNIKTQKWFKYESCMFC